MRQILTAFLFIVLFTSLVSAEIIIDQQPNDVYNLGDSVALPITIKALSDISGSFEMDLLCAENEINFYRNGISLSYGQEVTIAPAPSLVLTRNIIGNSNGRCKLRATLGNDIALTNEFEISNSLTITVPNKESNLEPGKSFMVEGEAIKQNGNSVEGFVDIEIIINLGLNDTTSLSYKGTINNGLFAVNVSIPKDAKAGNHLLKLNAYEKDTTEEITNQGLTNYNINIAQIPSNLEIFLENSFVEPGTNLKVKAILHDQTGEKIVDDAIITIKNKKDKLMEQSNKKTDELLEYPIAYNEMPGKWIILASSNGLNAEKNFNITRKEEVKVFLINKTVAVTNKGNVEYCNKTILVKIGESSINLEPCLDIDETRKYLLTAPDGNYDVEIIRDGERIISQSVSLTGRAIDAKEKGVSVLSAVRLPAVWIFFILILGVISIIFFKKGYKRTFIGSFKKKVFMTSKEKNDTLIEKRKHLFSKKKTMDIPHSAELSLSIKGNQQNSSVICLHLKNYESIEEGEGNVSETLKKIAHLAEEKKAKLYINKKYFFFIFAPSKTKTFKNEKPALKLAQKISSMLDAHNKIFKKHIDYGIGLNKGEIIAKAKGKDLIFMPLKTFLTTSKRTADHSKNKVLLSEEMKTQFGADVKTEKHTHENMIVHEIKEIVDRTKHNEFINNFLKKLEHDKKK
jgi:hypothetical protein